MERKKKRKNLYKFKFSGESKKALKKSGIRKMKKPGKGCSRKLTRPNLIIN